MPSPPVEPTPMAMDAVVASQNGTPKPTLGQLPPELKSLIVDMVYECDAEADEFEDESDGESESDGEEHDCAAHGPDGHHHHARAKPKPKHDCSTHAPGEHPADDDEGETTEALSGMWALALLDREFSALAQKYLWKEVDLTDRLAIDIGMFLIDILPRHGHHVEILCLQQQMEEWDGDLSGSFLAPRFLALGTHPSESDEERMLRFRRTLLAEIVERLPNVTSVQLDMVDLIDPDLEPHLQQKEVTDALRRVGHRITSSLTIEADDAGLVEVSEGYLGELLRSFPNVARLELALPLDPVGRPALQSSLVALASLRALMLENCAFVNAEFVALPWTCALETLALGNCEELSLPALLDLLARFESTLEVLDLEDVPANIIDTEMKLLRPQTLSKLDTLVLNTTHDVAFLQLFARAALRSLTIGFCPQITYAEWEAFITEHAGTLKEIEVQSGHEFSPGQIESLEVLCYAKQIECSVESDSEDDSESWSGEDGDEVESWEDDEDEGDDGSDEDD